MSSKTVNFKPAGSAGLCDIQYHPDGEHLITAGSDSMIKIHDKDGEPVELEFHEDAIYAIAINKTGDKFATASEDKSVICVRFTDNKVDKEVFKFPSPARTVAFSSKGFVAAGGDDKIIRAALLADHKTVTYFKGHEGEIRYIAYDPLDKYLTSSSTDGTVRIWDPFTGEQVACISDVLPTTQINDYQLCRFSWHPTGKLLAIPGKNNEIKIIERDTWKVFKSFPREHRAGISIVSWSPNGEFLASVGVDGQVIIWEPEKAESLVDYKHSSGTICGFVWNPKENAVAMIDINCNYGVWQGVIPNRLGNPFTLNADLKKSVENTKGLADLIADSDSEPKEKKNGTLKNKKAKEIVEDDRDPLDIIDGLDAPQEDPIQYSDFDDEEEEENEKVAPNTMKKVKAMQRTASINRAPVWTGPSVEVAPQRAFQPGASEPEKKRRFLVYNRIGTVVSREEAARTSIEIEFHDLNLHKPVKFTDHNNISMAALNEQAAVFASNAQNDTVSTIIYHPFYSWGTNSKWTCALPEGEDAQAIGICNNFVGVGTSSYFRIFTYSGIQYHLLSLPGPVVTVTGNDSVLVVVYHASAAPVENHLRFMVFDCVSKKVIMKDDLPLSQRSTLRWMGFSTIGMLTSVDSKGIVRVSTDEYQQWIPIADLSNSGESYWVFSLTDKVINCIPLRYGETSPSTFPKPVPTIVNYKLPLTQLELEIVQNEEKYLRESILLQHQKSKLKKVNDKEVQQNLVKQEGVLDMNLVSGIEMAIKQDKTERAYNYCEFVQFEKLLNGILEFANKQKLYTLSTKIGELMQKKFVVEEEEEEEEEEQENTQRSYKSRQSQQSQQSQVMDVEDEDSSAPKAKPSKKVDREDSMASTTSSVNEDESSQDSTASNKEYGKKKRNRFTSVDPNSKPSESGNIFATLNKLQEASDANKQKKRKFQSFFPKP